MYIKPNISMLGGVVEMDSAVAESVKVQQIAKMQSVLDQFKIKASVVEVKNGPVVTRFELKLSTGFRSGAILKLERDIARCMSVSSIRVLDIIEGTDRVGIEIPAQVRQTVNLANIIASEQYQNCGGIPIVLGCDIVGSPVVVDLTKAPHMLVAGTTGCGKSVAINSMIMSMLFRFTPDELKLVLIDPKMLEMSNYNGIDHLWKPVITDVNRADRALEEVVTEMDARYLTLCNAGVRNIREYNDGVLNGTINGQHMPYIVVVVDEFADLIMTNDWIEDQITRLAQKARAAGIHLIVATQRPSADVITGVIKANIPTRLALTVASKTDSRVIVDQSGAEALLGNGDMLVSLTGKELTRVHGCFVADEHIDTVVESIKRQSQPKNKIDAAVTYGGAGYNLTTHTIPVADSIVNPTPRVAIFERERDQLAIAVDALMLRNKMKH